MINQNDNTISWTNAANENMALVTLIDYLYDGKLIKNYTEHHHPYQPNYETLYNNHKELLNDMSKIFCPQLIKPSEINKKGSNEYDLFLVINSIFDIVWYRNIEKSGNRAYFKKRKELDKSKLFLLRYVKDHKTFDELIDFPFHEKETLKLLQEYLINKRLQQEPKVINAIKSHFGIRKITATNKQKKAKQISSMVKRIKKSMKK